MIAEIKNVAVLGASGKMGSLTGGIIAQSGIKVFFLSRTKDGAEAGKRAAIDQARAEVIGNNIKCGDYTMCLEKALRDADWILEAVSEDIAIKKSMFAQIDQMRKKTSIVSSMTSSLPLQTLCEGRSESFRAHFLSTHFYNPPSRLLACEIAGHSATDPAIMEFMKGFLETSLGRVTVTVYDTPAFAGNRIAFLLFSQAAEAVPQMGVATVDYLLGPYTGRALSPLLTLDLVGIDIHAVIIKTIKEYVQDDFSAFFSMQNYVNTMLAENKLGNKTPMNGGFYKKDSSKKKFIIDPRHGSYSEYKRPRMAFVENAIECIRFGQYFKAFEIIIKEPCEEATFIKKILLFYIAYSFYCIGKVSPVENGIDTIDNVMSSGFNWAPPSVLLSMMGGTVKVKKLMGQSSLPIPENLERFEPKSRLPSNYGKYFIAR